MELPETRFEDCLGEWTGQVEWFLPLTAQKREYLINFERERTVADIYLVGHGNWLTKGSPNGYCKVPKNTEVVFYTPVGRFINSDQVAAIVRKEAGRLQPDQTVGEFKMCPDLTLSHGLMQDETDALVESGVRYVEVNNPTLLSDLLATHAGNTIHWLACRVRLGADDFDSGGTNQDYRPDQGIGVNGDRAFRLR